jgi:holo-[acyl-carrier protein] synthase
MPGRGLIVAVSPCKQTNKTLSGRDPSPGSRRRLLGLGTDLCAVPRLTRQIERPEAGFLEAVFRPDEIARCTAQRHPDRAFAACFAAKEAVVKALAEARQPGTYWQEIEIGDDGDGRPAVTLHGRIAGLARALGVRRILLSHAHCRDYATACAIASG